MRTFYSPERIYLNEKERTNTEESINYYADI